MKKDDITIDELLDKIPNKYELAILAGKMARKDFLKGIAKNKIIPQVFKEIMDDVEK